MAGLILTAIAAVTKLGTTILARLILVSNRVSIPRTGGAQRAGGLEVALAPILKVFPTVWFGWSGNVVQADAVATQTVERSGTSYVVTDLSEEDYQEYYNGFANRVLWPVLHYRVDLTEFTRRDLTGYFRVNRHFASELSKLLRPDDIVWVHDYQLIPIAEELRQRGHTNRIGFFLHVPFPAPEVMAVLPNHERLLPSLLQYDLVGFQTETDVGNFVRYLIAEHRGPSRKVFEATDNQLVFSCGGRQTRIGSFPVGIATDEFQRLARRAVQFSFVRDLIVSLENRRLVIGVDRLDYSKGLIQRMEAFERFYAMHPEWQGQATYLQIAPKSRSDIPEYHELEQAVSAAAGRINGMYGEVSWTPIRYLNRAYGRSALAGIYRSAHAALVTPLRDGMNLVAKEYVAAQDADDPGVLILSRFAGAAVECDQALLVNPYDADSVVSAIARALHMPLVERRERHGAMLARLERNGGTVWSTRFLQSLGCTQMDAEPLLETRPPVPSPRKFKPDTPALGVETWAAELSSSK
jgi:trehalose 6-phosphate synthase